MGKPVQQRAGCHAIPQELYSREEGSCSTEKKEFVLLRVEVG